MKRVQEKIKDLVEPQVYDEVRNFVDAPARILAAYRFTDATSDLLARWLDALADLPRGRGAARALAGLRGVGKSHTLATFGALVAAPELRAQVGDAHVATSARRLAHRRFVVVRAERGTRPALQAELAEAFAKALGGPPEQWAGSPAEVLRQAAAQARGATVVVLVDTAYGRSSRVRRDDGPLLSELATAAHDASAFVGLALDDDITGADGVNVALARTFQIDYLEPEHLYHVANSYLLRKTAPARNVLHDIYLSLRGAVPNFNWSEPRYAALYPVHPLVAEVAASVRLFAPEFAFLPFAVTAAQRAGNRPALSLILLDEVFDSTERELRRAEELKEPFRVYDELAASAVGQFPAMQRLQVRLVLKSLFVLSLDGRGATARELCAALLLYDEAEPEAAVAGVEEWLSRLAQSLPAGLHVSADVGELRYRFPVNAADNFEAALAKASESAPVPAEAVASLLRTLARSRFADWPLAGEAGEALAGALYVAWRGSSRPGRLVRPTGDRPEVAMETGSAAAPAEVEQGADADDWQVFILDPGADPDGIAGGLLPECQSASPEPDASAEADGSEPLRYAWLPAAPTPDELVVLRRLSTLRSDQSLANFGEVSRAAAAALAAHAERIWSRLYVDAGALVPVRERGAVGDASRLAFDDEARAATNLSALLARALAPLFDARYPQHPSFGAPLNDADGTRLIENFFGGAGGSQPDLQPLAAQLAAPLGLAVLRGGAYTLETGDAVLERPWVREVLARADAANGEVVPLGEIERALARPPYGLTRASRQLVLAALVAQRRVELVTASGDRVSRRTLGRALRWDDIAGVCRAAGIHLGAEELTAWARLLTNRPELAPIGEAAAREEVRAALGAWLDVWHAGTTLEEFELLPDAGLTTRAWGLAANVRRTLGAAADAVRAALAGDVSLEEGLQRVADAFAGQPAQLALAAEQLEALGEYTRGVVRRERVRGYLVSAEPTGVEPLESARRELLLLADDPHTLFDAALRERFELLWREFQAHYAAHYAELHERCAGRRRDTRALDDLICGDEWRDFEALARLPFVNGQIWAEAESLLKEARGARCELPVAEVLAERPRCHCSFRLARAELLLGAAPYLGELARRGRGSYRRTLALFHAHLAQALEEAAREEPLEESAGRAGGLAALFAQNRQPELFTPADVGLIARRLEQTPPPAPPRATLPRDLSGLLTRDELAARWRQWLDELPDGPALVEVGT